MYTTPFELLHDGNGAVGQQQLMPIQRLESFHFPLRNTSGK